MQDIEEQETREHQHTLNVLFENTAFAAQSGGGGGGGRSNNNSNQAANGFIVQGGPWEQRATATAAAPNTASVTEFPSFGRNTEPAPQAAPISGAWGAPRR